MLSVTRVTPMLKRKSIVKPLRDLNFDTNCRPVQDFHANPTANFHHLAESSLTTAESAKTGVSGLTACTALTLAGSRCFAKRSEGDRSDPVMGSRKQMLDPSQMKSHSEAKMEEMKRKLKEKGLMKDLPKKPPIF